MKDEYTFIVQAVDIGGRTGFTTLQVVVDDKNDNSPKFSQSSYKSLIRANTSTNAIVLMVN